MNSSQAKRALVVLGALLGTFAKATASDAPSSTSTHGTQQQGLMGVQDDGIAIRTAQVMGLDGTTISMVVNESGQAVSVATQAPEGPRKHKKRKHAPVGENPADEPLIAGMTNEESPTLVEDALPQISNDLGH